jgi:hypothetical protein
MIICKLTVTKDSDNTMDKPPLSICRIEDRIEITLTDPTRSVRVYYDDLIKALRALKEGDD